MEDWTEETELFVFPFSSFPIGRSNYAMDDATLKGDGITDEGENPTSSVRAQIHFTRDGLTAKSITLPFGISNLSHQIDLSTEEGGGPQMGAEIADDLQDQFSIGSIFQQIKVNEMLQKGFIFLSKLSGDSGEYFPNVMILPTADPSVFRIIVLIGMDKSDTTDEYGNVDVNYDPDALLDDADEFSETMEKLSKDSKDDDDDDNDDDDDDDSGADVDVNFYGAVMLEAKLGVAGGS